MAEKNSICIAYDHEIKSECIGLTIDYFIIYLYYFLISKQISHSHAILTWRGIDFCDETPRFSFEQSSLGVTPFQPSADIQTQGRNPALQDD